MNSTDDELLEIVDAEDNVLGIATRREIHNSGFMHRAVHIFVFNSAGEIYVQKRSDSKDRHPGKLDSSAAGHVDPGESYLETAIRELREEIGLSADLEEVLRIKASKITDYEHVALFRAVTDQLPVPNPDEIQWGEFFERIELTRRMAEFPDEFVPGFIFLWNELLRLS